MVETCVDMVELGGWHFTVANVLCQRHRRRLNERGACRVRKYSIRRFGILQYFGNSIVRIALTVLRRLRYAGGIFSVAPGILEYRRIRIATSSFNKSKQSATAIPMI